MKISNRCLSLSFLSAWAGVVFVLHQIWNEYIFDLVGPMLGYSSEAIHDISYYQPFSSVEQLLTLFLLFMFFFGWIFILLDEKSKNIPNLVFLYSFILIGFLAAFYSFTISPNSCFPFTHQSYEFYDPNKMWEW